MRRSRTWNKYFTLFSGFSHVSSLVVHRRRVHEQVKPFLCSKCPRAFYSSTSLKSHFSVHSTAKRYRCKVFFTLWNFVYNLFYSWKKTLISWMYKWYTPVTFSTVGAVFVIIGVFGFGTFSTCSTLYGSMYPPSSAAVYKMSASLWNLP